jgi:hypothetical protein
MFLTTEKTIIQLKGLIVKDRPTSVVYQHSRLNLISNNKNTNNIMSPDPNLIQRLDNILTTPFL